MANFGGETLPKIIDEDDIEKKDDDGHTPLALATIDMKTDLVKDLINRGSNINSQNVQNETPLMFASLNGNVEIIASLLVGGADLEMKDGIGRTALQYATYTGAISAVKELLKHEAKVNTKSTTRITPLISASLHGYQDIVSILINKGANLEDKTDKGQTALYAAASYGHLKVAQNLLSHGANVNSPGIDGSTPLLIALCHKQFAMMQKLIQHGADINSQKNAKTSAFLYASHRVEDAKYIALLLENGAHVNMKCDCCGRTALSKASFKGHRSVVEKLLQYEVTVNTKDDSGYTPLILSSYKGHSEVVTTLLQSAAELEIRNTYGQTALSAATQNGHLNVTNELLRCGANVNAQDERGQTPLIIASEYGHLGIVNILLNYDADINIQTLVRNTALHQATAATKYEIVERLLLNGADVDLVNSSNQTAHELAAAKCDERMKMLYTDLKTEVYLHKACKNGNYSELMKETENAFSFLTKNGLSILMLCTKYGHNNMVQKCISEGADVNICDNNQNTPLHIACKSANLQVLKLLLGNEANCNIPNRYGDTPLHVAVQGQFLNTVKSLLKHGAIEQANNKGEYPVDIAMNQSDENMINMLHGKGIKLTPVLPSLTTTTGETSSNMVTSSRSDSLFTETPMESLNTGSMKDQESSNPKDSKDSLLSQTPLEILNNVFTKLQVAEVSDAKEPTSPNEYKEAVGHKLTETQLKYVHQISPSICCIYNPTRGGAVGTGIVLGAVTLSQTGDLHRFVLTCYHCDLQDAFRNYIRCKAEFGVTAQYHAGCVVPIKPHIFYSNSTLDYCLICLEPSAELEQYLLVNNAVDLGYNITDSVPQNNDPLIIISHPPGDKKIDFGVHAVLSANYQSTSKVLLAKQNGMGHNIHRLDDKRFMFYQCHSFKGASGGPCFSAHTKTLYAMHCGGVFTQEDTSNSKNSIVEFGILLWNVIKDIETHVLESKNAGLSLTVGIDELYKLFPNLQ